ncbi:hypothetical protein [Amycolatopsis sp. NPDC004378]
MNRLRWVLLSALLLCVTGCDPAQSAVPSTWTPRPVTATWPPSASDLSYYLPADAALAKAGLTRRGLPVPNPRIVLLKLCGFTQPWDGLVKQGLEATWRVGSTGQDVRQYITRYDHVAGKDVLGAIDDDLLSCGAFPLDGKEYHTITSGIGLAGTTAADEAGTFCAEPEPGGQPRCFLLLASRDRLTELVLPGDAPLRDQLDFLAAIAPAFSVALARGG